MKLQQFFRLLQINHVLSKHRLDDIIQATHLIRPLRYLSYLSPYRLTHSKKIPRGERLRLALQDLGPIFVKFGQLLSTRRDLLPEDIADSLAKLQDQVAPFSNEQALELIAKAYGENNIDQYFNHIDQAPLASASIAQVHAAQLTDGTDVIIKLVRPNIEKTIKHDVALLYTIAGLAERYWSEGKRLRPTAVVAELEKNLFDELDMLREGASASQLKRNFEGTQLLYVPDVYWTLCKPNVLVQERVYGIPIGDIDALSEANVNLERLAEIGVEIFFTQIFKHSFFHADMHPGNIMVDASDPENPKYVAIDFGIMGTLAPDDQRYLADNFLAFFNHDYQRVAELHIESGWVPSDTRLDEFEAAIRSVCEPIFAKPLKEISFGQLLLRLFQTARRFNMEVQPQLVLLQKTLLNIEGLGRQLYPDLDLWKTAKPILEQWMAERMSAKTAFKTLQKEAPNWLHTLPTLPRLLHDLSQQMQEGKMTMQLSTKDKGELTRQIHHANQRSLRAILGGTLLISASVIYGLAPSDSARLLDIPLVSWGLGVWGAGLVFFSFKKPHH